MSVVVEIKDVGPCRKQVKVEVPAPAVEAETQRVVSELRKRTRMPGFRRGKVPIEMIRRKFRQDIEKEVVERLLPRYWRQAEAESELEPLLPPSVDEVDLEPGAGLTFLASVEVRPPIELGDIEDFDLPETATEPDAEEVEKAILDLRRAVADWVEVDRSAARGDTVSGELLEVETETDESPEPKPISFEVGDPQVWEELSLAVTGKMPAQSEVFERREGVGEESQKRRFQITVESIKERHLPDLDDELAARLGEFGSVVELKEDVLQRLRRAKRVERRQKRERALVDQLRERHPLELPRGVVDSEIEDMLREYAQSLADSGVDLEKTGFDWQSLAQQVRPQAERRVHARLLLDAVASKLALVVDEEEFERTLSAVARSQGRSTVKVRQELDRSGRLAGLREQMRREKALRKLLREESGADDAAPATPSEIQLQTHE